MTLLKQILVLLIVRCEKEACQRASMAEHVLWTYVEKSAWYSPHFYSSKGYAQGTETGIFWWQTRVIYVSRLNFSILTTEKSLPSMYYNQYNGAVAHNLTLRVCLQTNHIDLLQSLTKVTPNPWTPFVKTYKTINATKHLFLPIFFSANSVIKRWRNICR